MTQIELRTRVGPDGILTLTVPVGIDEANREVKVVVEPAEAAVGPATTSTRDESERAVDRTAGAPRSDSERSEPGESVPQGRAPAEDYPIADWIEPIEYKWSLDYYKAEQAVRQYLKDSHADH